MMKIYLPRCQSARRFECSADFSYTNMTSRAFSYMYIFPYMCVIYRMHGSSRMHGLNLGIVIELLVDMSLLVCKLYQLEFLNP